MNLIKFFLFLSIWFLHFTSRAQTSSDGEDCKKFHSGIFTTPLEAGGEIKITRKKDYQIEEYQGESIKLKINWVSDCEYHLTILSVFNKEKSDMVGKILKVKITKVEGDSYYYSAMIEGEDKIIKNKVTKIR